MEKTPPDTIADWCGGRWHPTKPPEPVRAVCVDSRRAGPGHLFFALKGERADGHAFLAAVAAASAYAVVRGDFPVAQLPPNGFFLQVDDPLAALGRFAATYRRQMPARIAGVTGSVGKTATKEMLADALAALGRTVRTAGNYNNEIGLPLSLAELERDCIFGVFEVGISHPGEMSALRDILMPEIVVVTRLGSAHIEFFPSVRAIAEEKAALLDRLPAHGFAVLDCDDDYYDVLRQHSPAPVTTCSLRSCGADYSGEIQPGGQLRVEELATGQSAVLPVPPPAAFMAENALKAIAAARRCGVPWSALEKTLAGYQPVGQRWAVEEFRGWTTINDGYNANPDSMRAALQAFAEWPARGKKYLALGPMLEQGRLEQYEHEALGRFVAAGDWAGVVIVPAQPSDISEAAVQALAEGLGAGDWPAEATGLASGPAAAAAWLRERLRPGDALLLKASRSVRIEQVLAALKQED